MSAANSKKQRGRPFAKGKSGNPSGRPKVVTEVRDLARQHTVAAIEKIVALLDAESEGTQLAAAIALLDRGYGKPAQAHTGEGGEGPVELLHKIERVIVDHA